MPDFKILDVFEQNCHLVVQAQHYRPDGASWFTEHYRWQGREGMKHKRLTNDQGQILMDDGNPAPFTESLQDIPQQYLPDGREWARHTGLHISESNILDTIQQTHNQRLVSGWASTDGTLDTVASFSDSDSDGCHLLLTTFVGLKGREV